MFSFVCSGNAKSQRRPSPAPPGRVIPVSAKYHRRSGKSSTFGGASGEGFDCGRPDAHDGRRDVDPSDKYAPAAKSNVPLVAASGGGGIGLRSHAVGGVRARRSLVCPRKSRAGVLAPCGLKLFSAHGRSTLVYGALPAGVNDLVGRRSTPMGQWAARIPPQQRRSSRTQRGVGLCVGA